MRNVTLLMQNSQLNAQQKSRMNFQIGGEGDFQISNINHAGQEPSLTGDPNTDPKTLDAFHSPDKQ